VLVTFPTIRETIQFFQNRTWLFFVVVMVLVLAQYLPKPRRPIL
jgi:hypothetical protein